jgi:hypothetical protein
VSHERDDEMSVAEKKGIEGIVYFVLLSRNIKGLEGLFQSVLLRYHG